MRLLLLSAFAVLLLSRLRVLITKKQKVIHDIDTQTLTHKRQLAEERIS